MRNVADVLHEYLTGAHRDDDLLVEYGGPTRQPRRVQAAGLRPRTSCTSTRPGSWRHVWRGGARASSRSIPPWRQRDASCGAGASERTSPWARLGRVVITRADIVERVTEWGLTEEVIEKDYVLGLAAVGDRHRPGPRGDVGLQGRDLSQEVLHRDLPLLRGPGLHGAPGGPVPPRRHRAAPGRVPWRASPTSRVSTSRPRHDCASVPMGPRPRGACTTSAHGGRRSPHAVKLDISADEVVVRPPVLERSPTRIPTPSRPGARSVATPSMSCSPRRSERWHSADGRATCTTSSTSSGATTSACTPMRSVPRSSEKCAAKSIAVPTAADFADSPLLVELESEWGNMLGHQLPALPPLAPFLEELPVLFAWLDGEVEEAAAGVIAYARDEDQSWSPPPTCRDVAGRGAAGDGALLGREPPPDRAGLRRPDPSHRAVLPSPHPCWQPDPSRRACRRERPPRLPRREDPRPAHDHDAVPPAVPDRVLCPRAAARAAAVPDPRPAGEPRDGLAFVADDRSTCTSARVAAANSPTRRATLRFVNTTTRTVTAAAGRSGRYVGRRY